MTGISAVETSCNVFAPSGAPFYASSHTSSVDHRTQALFSLERATYASPQIVQSSPQHPELPTNNIYEALGMRYRFVPLGETHACPIDKGSASEWGRIITIDMPYAGTDKAVLLPKQVP